MKEPRIFEVKIKEYFDKKLQKLTIEEKPELYIFFWNRLFYKRSPLTLREGNRDFFILLTKNQKSHKIVA